MTYDIHNVFFGAITLTQPIFMGGKIVALNKLTKAAEIAAKELGNAETENVILCRRRRLLAASSVAEGQVPPRTELREPARLALIMLVNDRAENFEADLFLRQRSIAGYATEAKG